MQLNSRQNLISISPYMLAIAFLLAPLSATAQAVPIQSESPEPQPGPSESIQEGNSAELVESGESCVPPCRSTFMCLDGFCVSRCNPPCPTGEKCTDNGECIPDNPPAPTQPIQSYTRPPHSRGGYSHNHMRQNQNTNNQIQMENFKYNKLKYKKFKKKKAAGGAMLGIGLVLCGASIPFYFASDEDLSGFKVGGALLDIVGTILFIAGIVNLVKGKIGMDKAEQGLFRKPVNFGLTDELIYRF